MVSIDPHIGRPGRRRRPGLYAGSHCGTSTATMPQLLSPDTYLKARTILQGITAVGDKLRHTVPMTLNESDSASCSGQPGVSDAYGSSLWALDHLLETARTASAACCSTPTPLLAEATSRPAARSTTPSPAATTAPSASPSRHARRAPAVRRPAPLRPVGLPPAARAPLRRPRPAGRGPGQAERVRHPGRGREPARGAHQHPGPRGCGLHRRHRHSQPSPGLPWRPADNPRLFDGGRVVLTGHLGHRRHR